MTQEEAMGNLIHAIRWNDMPKKEALEMAIKALEQHPCEDCISRQAVLDSIYANCIYESEYNLTAKHIEDAVKQLPSVTPQPKTGRWVYEGEGSGYKKWHCSNCKMLVRNPEKPWYSFCPNCGQPKMKEVEE